MHRKSLLPRANLRTLSAICLQSFQNQAHGASNFSYGTVFNTGANTIQAIWPIRCENRAFSKSQNGNVKREEG